MDGAQLASIDIAEHKARAAAMFRRETRAFEDAVQNGLVYQLTLDGMMASRGGIPLVADGKIVGAVGVSGGAILAGRGGRQGRRRGLPRLNAPRQEPPCRPRPNP